MSTTKTFTTKIYGVEMGGTVSQRGWTADRKTNIALKNLDPEKARRARLRLKKASEAVLETA